MFIVIVIIYLNIRLYFLLLNKYCLTELAIAQQINMYSKFQL